MFEREEVARDKYGFFYHSALRGSEEEEIRKVPGAEGMDFRFVSFESDAPQELQELYQGDPNVVGETWPEAVRRWEPTPPAGEGWFIFAIYDTEDGPFCCFTRPAPTGAFNLDVAVERADPEATTDSFS